MAAVHEAAFGGGAHGRAVANLVDDLRAASVRGNGLSLVAEEDGQVVGNVVFSRCLLDAPRRLVAVQVLSPIGVRPTHQGRGIGSALIRSGIHVLTRRREPLTFLEGAPGYYARFGFQPAGQHGFRKPSLRIPDPAFQVLRLAAYEDWMTGTLVYSDAFWRHDLVGLREVEA